MPHKGYKWTEERRAKSLGNKPGNFKVSPGYSAIHKWVKYHLGIIKECAYCAENGRIEWANISGRYTRELTDYVPLCVKCHRKYDNWSFKAQGSRRKNPKPNVTNKSSGIKGVAWEKSMNRWRAYIQLNGKKKNLGRFKDIQKAYQARKIAESIYFPSCVK